MVKSSTHVPWGYGFESCHIMTGKALAYGRAKCYSDKGANGYSEKVLESEMSESDVRSSDRWVTILPKYIITEYYS